MFLIDDILLAPFKGLVWLAEEFKKMGEKELFDEDGVKTKLMELQFRFELDEISEEEYKRSEDELLAQLETIRKAKEKEVS